MLLRTNVDLVLAAVRGFKTISRASGQVCKLCELVFLFIFSSENIFQMHIKSIIEIGND